MNLAYLQKRHPNYQWSAQKNGMSWEYVGRNESTGDTVCLQARASVFDADGVYPATWYCYRAGEPAVFYGADAKLMLVVRS